MGAEATDFLYAAVIGLGATLFMDLWVLVMKSVFGIPSSNYCLVGRWVRHMPEGRFMHASIVNASRMRFECTVGWISHYVIGAGYAVAFVALVSGVWLARPTLLPALFFGVGTVLVPFLVMQPSFGLGIAASKAPSPTQARLRSLMAHVAFGVGLYLCGAGVHLARASVPPEQSIDGTYELQERVLANGTVLRPPAIVALYDLHRGKFNLNVFIRNSDGTIASESTIGRYTFSTRQYCEWITYTTRNNLDKPGVTNEAPALADHCAPVTSQNGRFNFSPPGESVTMSVGPEGFTANISGEFVDHWQKIR